LDAIADDVSSNWLHVSSLLASIEPFMPVVDASGTGVIDDQFHTLLATNRLPNRVPTMFTTVSDESSLYVNRLIDNLGSSQTFLNFLFEFAYPPGLASALVTSSTFQTNRTQDDSVRILGAEALTASEWTCPLSHLLRNGGTASLPTLYNVEITDGHAQNNDSASVPDICFPNPNYNATCHASDVLPAWGTLNSKTLNVQPYHGVRDLHHSQYLNDVFGAFFRTYDPNPDVEMLKLRGPAYAATYRIFGERGYRIERYNNETDTLASLGMPPSRAKNPGVTERCAVFEEYGFTFENTKLT
jgi:acetylcholinesterase